MSGKDDADSTLTLNLWGAAAALKDTLDPDRGDPLPAPTGRQIGRFEVLGELGAGGMGRVLEVRDPELGREVAVKLIIDPASVSPRQLARFIAEAQLSAQLIHPNIVPVHDIGRTEAGRVYFVMQKIEGQSLAELLQTCAAETDSAARLHARYRLLTIFLQVCNAVAYAHDLGVVHRDLKPANVMLGPYGQVQLLDWGVALVLPGSPLQRPPDQLATASLGTPGYMSPEQIRGGGIDQRSDIWSLGSILFEILTLSPAYSGDSVHAIIERTTDGPAPDPRVEKRDPPVPDPLARICVRALAPRPADRFESVALMADAIEAFLEGRRKRIDAAQHLERAERAWHDYRALALERDALAARERDLRDSIEPWAPLSHKRELHTVLRQLQRLELDRAQVFTTVVSECDRGLALDPESAALRGILAEAHFHRFEEAEAHRRPEARLYHRGRVEQFDDGRFSAALDAPATLTLRTDPPGAEVWCQAVDTTAVPRWPLGERRLLGRTPLVDAPLAPGSYVLTLTAPGRRDTTYPVLAERGKAWRTPAPVPLLSDADIGADCVYVPGGPFLTGDPSDRETGMTSRHVDGFIMRRYVITMADYVEFIRAAALDDPERAWRRVPRVESGFGGDGGQYWERPEDGRSYILPTVDRDGDHWDPAFPVFGVSWHDVMAYCAWRSAVDGVTWRLPSADEWEKAARGVDGRLFPWGDTFDAALCKMRDSRSIPLQPEPIGSFPMDVSVYGMRDAAGNMREWCARQPGEGQRPVRGGSWHSSPKDCRLTYRFAYEPWVVHTNLGFRLVRHLNV